MTKVKKIDNVDAFSKPEGKKWISDMLRSNIIDVTFEKIDGTTRQMRCTLIESEIPQQKMPKNSGKAKNDDALAVFDLDKNDWRSFRFDSVRRIQISTVR